MILFWAKNMQTKSKMEAVDKLILASKPLYDERIAEQRREIERLKKQTATVEASKVNGKNVYRVDDCTDLAFGRFAYYISDLELKPFAEKMVDRCVGKLVNKPLHISEKEIDDQRIVYELQFQYYRLSLNIERILSGKQTQRMELII